MANIIGFKEDVDRYYRHYNQDGSWASVLSNATRNYGAYNQQQVNQATQQNKGVLNYAQSEVSKLYGQYQNERKQVGDSAFSGALKTQVTAEYDKNLSGSTKQTAQDITTKNMVTPELADVNKDAGVQAYGQQVEGTAKMTADIFGFLQDSMVTDDGTPYTVERLVQDGYLEGSNGAYELTDLGKNKFAQLSEDTVDGNQFETYLKDKYGDKYNPEESAYFLQSSADVLGNEEIASGAGFDQAASIATASYARDPNIKVVFGEKVDADKKVGKEYTIREESNIRGITFTGKDGRVVTFDQALKSGLYDNVKFTIGNGATYYIRDGKAYTVKK